MTDITDDTAFDEKYYAQQRLEGEVATLERQIEGHEKQIKKGEALLRLEQNEDFKMIIEEGFLKELALNAVYSRSQTGDEKIKAEMDDVITGCGILKTHLIGLMQLHAHAQLKLPQDRDELIRLKQLNIQ